MTAFWHGFIIVLTVLSIVGCLWLLLTQSRGKTGPETTHTWDDDLTEYNNPLPRWWLNMFVITIVFGVGYLVFYPGLGNVAGRLGWTSQGEMQARLDQLTAQRQAQYAKLTGKSVAELAHDSTAQALGRSIFLANCAGCHGTDARGAIGFPNLVDKDWLYGGHAETVLTTIENGRNGQMPAFFGALPPEKLAALLDFLPYWADPDLDAVKRTAGLEAFSGTCAACHGADGKGNVAMGAPNLTDEVWLWGGRKEQIRETILYGRKNHMPAHKTLITADEARVVAGYVLSLAEDGAITDTSSASGAGESLASR